MVAKTRPRVAGRRMVGQPYDRSFAEAFERLERHKRALETHRKEVDVFRSALEERAAETARLFGLVWHDFEPKELDVLSWAIPAGEHWRWDGWTNNKGCPIVRVRSRSDRRINSDHSVNPILHRLFVPAHSPPPNMRQQCGAEFICVRPEHRCKVCLGGAK